MSLKFKIEIRKIETKKINGFIFTILHPNTNEPVYEFIYEFQELGKRICEEIIKEINEGLENEMQKL